MNGIEIRKNGKKLKTTDKTYKAIMKEIKNIPHTKGFPKVGDFVKSDLGYINDFARKYGVEIRLRGGCIGSLLLVLEGTEKFLLYDIVANKEFYCGVCLAKIRREGWKIS